MIFQIDLCIVSFEWAKLGHIKSFCRHQIPHSCSQAISFFKSSASHQWRPPFNLHQFKIVPKAEWCEGLYARHIVQRLGPQVISSFKSSTFHFSRPQFNFRYFGVVSQAECFEWHCARSIVHPTGSTHLPMVANYTSVPNSGRKMRSLTTGNHGWHGTDPSFHSLNPLKPTTSEHVVSHILFNDLRFESVNV